MGDMWSSTNDPLFFMHHAQMGRLWALWQSLDPSFVHSIGVPVYANGTGLTTLDYPTHTLDVVGPTVDFQTVIETMSKEGECSLCCRYEEN